MSTAGSDTPSTSRDLAIASDQNSLIAFQAQRKILEEDEYLGRMAHIIKRDFFAGSELLDSDQAPPESVASIRTNNSPYNTPGTDRTGISTTSSVRSRKEACSTRLNEFLDNYTSEDNAYFDKLQEKELKRHRLRFPWLYKHEKNNGAKGNSKASSEIAARRSEIGYIHRSSDDPRDCLSYRSSESSLHDRPYTSTVNYESSKYMRGPIFKEPHPVGEARNWPRRSLNRFTDKIGIDGKLLDGSETPSINGYSYIPPPESQRLLPESPKIKQETNRFFLPNVSPRDALAHRLYEDKVAKKIRTPKSSTRSDNLKTPKSELDRIF